MSKLSLILLIILNTLLTVSSEAGVCPNVQVMKDFKPEKYVGKWYEIERYPMFFEDATKCSNAEYTLNFDGSLGFLNSAILIVIGEVIGVNGTAVPEAANPANMTLDYGSAVDYGSYLVPKSRKLILDTDYNTYSLVYSCRQSSDLGDPTRIEFSWILSRTQTLDKQIVNHLKSRLSALNSTVSNFETTDQTDCEFGEE